MTPYTGEHFMKLKEKGNIDEIIEIFDEQLLYKPKVFQIKTLVKML